MLVEHFDLLSWFAKERRLKQKNHAQDCRTLITTSDQQPAILPWSLYFGWHPSFRAVTGILPHPAAGLLLDDLAHDRLSKFESMVVGKSCESARNRRARTLPISTTNVMLFE
jgi:hypothetical protein